MRSFSTALSVFIVLVTGTVFCVVFFMFYLSAKNNLEDEVYKRMQSDMQIAVGHIETSIAKVEQEVNRSAIVVNENSINPNVFRKSILTMLNTNSSIYGSCVALEPNFFPEKGKYYMPYLYRKNDSIFEIENAGNESYNYFLMEWYKNPKRTEKSYWSEPYFDKYAGDVFMVTYSQVLKDSLGNFYGVVTGDIELSRFTRWIDSAKFNSGATVKLISRNNKLLAGSSKILPYNIEKNELSAFIPETGWTIVMQIPLSEINDALYEMSENAVMTAIIGLLVIFMVVFLVIRYTTAPLKTFADVANKIAKGDFNVEVPNISHRDEFDKLTKAFVFMQKSLRNYIEQLKVTIAIQQSMKKELQIANTIQMDMLSKNFSEFSDETGFDIFADLRPAKAVGGDLYDFFAKDDKLFFCIGDVSGKGVPAALFMTVACALFRSACRLFDDPVKITESINDSIIGQNDSDMFVTLFVGVYIPSDEGTADIPGGRKGELRFCNAGHNPPLIIKDGGVSFLNTNKGTSNPNIPVGVISNFKYTGGSVEMGKGDAIFLYTDGVTEAQNDKGGFFGSERMLDVVRANAALNCHDLILIVKKSIDAFTNGAEQSDDLTKMAIRIGLPPPP